MFHQVQCHILTLEWHFSGPPALIPLPFLCPIYSDHTTPRIYRHASPLPGAGKTIRARCLVLFHSPRSAGSAIRIGKSCIDAPPDRVPGIPAPKRQSHPPRMRNQPARQIHQILHHTPQAPARHRRAQRSLLVHRHPLVPQRFLPAQPQAIVRHHPQQQHHRIRRHFPRRQPLQVHVAFNFRMKLLAGSMRVIQGDDRLGRVGQRGFVGVHFHLRDQQDLSRGFRGVESCQPILL